MNNILEINFPDTTYTFADFFAGCGGFSLGFINAGMKCISALEWNDAAAWTYWYNLCYQGWSHLWIDPNDEAKIKQMKKSNFWNNGKTSNTIFKSPPDDFWLKSKRPQPCLNLFLMDILKLNPEQWMEMCGIRPGDVRVFVGGPPCQGFSTAGRRELFDERNQLPLAMIHYAKVCKPEYVLIENVPGLISLGRKKGEKEGPFVKWIREAFEDAGYYMEWKIHNAKDYGVPQNRKRVLFFAVKKGAEPIEKILKESDMIQEYVDVREAIGDLPPIQNGETYQGNPYGYNKKEGYVICPSCLKYNKKVRTHCHDCGKELSNPITGGVFFYNGMTMLDCKNDFVYKP